MAEKKNYKKIISDQVVEVRFKPNPRFFDFRGQLLDVMLSGLKLTEWQLVDNRVIFSDKNRLKRAFVTYKNAGLVITDRHQNDEFLHDSKKFIELLLQQPPFTPPFYCDRIGVRFQYAVEYKGTFESLLSRYQTKAISLNERLQNSLAGQIVDLGNPVNLKTDDGFINFQHGPMKSDQLPQFLPERQSYFETSYYVDLDYWIRPKKVMSPDQIIEIINRFSMQNEERFEKIVNTVMG